MKLWQVLSDMLEMRVFLQLASVDGGADIVTENIISTPVWIETRNSAQMCKELDSEITPQPSSNSHYVHVITQPTWTRPVQSESSPVQLSSNVPDVTPCLFHLMLIHPPTKSVGTTSQTQPWLGPFHFSQFTPEFHWIPGQKNKTRPGGSLTCYVDGLPKESLTV